MCPIPRYAAWPAGRGAGGVFLLSGALPFVAYIQALRGKPLRLLNDPQIRFLVAFVAAVSVALALWLVATQQYAFGDALRLAAFNVVSIATTTGFATADYQAWGSFPFIVFFMLTFVGGCTGSTSGGVKALRPIVLRSEARSVGEEGVRTCRSRG